jgi:hypothetical protein
MARTPVTDAHKPLWAAKGAAGVAVVLYEFHSEWRRGWGSNPRPVGYEPTDLPLIYPAIGAERWYRATGLRLFRPALYQLSYLG